MKKTLWVSLIFILALLIPQASWAEFKKTKIAVLDFQLQGEGYETKDMGKIVAEWLITSLVKEGRFDVIERNLLEKVLKEQELPMYGVVDSKTAAKTGMVVGAKVVITGSVTRLQNVMEVNARIIDVESASIIAAESVKSASAVKLEDLVVQMAEKIIKDFPLEGYIVQKNGEKVLIDLGKRAGVKTGMQFMVFKEGKIIKHPKTGEVLDIEKIDTGTIEIKDVREKTSEGVIVKEAPQNAVKEGQLVKSMVELVPPPVVDIKPEKPKKHEKTPSEAVKTPADADLQAKLREIDSQVEEAGQMKQVSNPVWKSTLKNAFVSLKSLLTQYSTSPEVYLSFARAYYTADKFTDAEKSLKKAFYYNPQYVDALIFKGDMYSDYTARKLTPAERRETDYDGIARSAYQLVIKITQDKDLRAMMYYKIGNVYADVSGEKTSARQNWQMAVSTAPNSQAAKLANERLKAGAD